MLWLTCLLHEIRMLLVTDRCPRYCAADVDGGRRHQAPPWCCGLGPCRPTHGYRPSPMRSKSVAAPTAVPPISGAIIRCRPLLRHL
ncbi:hypothetical protein EVAR_39633_1 [Eumeta japonica]|uniref:Secreted protein n=1 Tax=Eumeta variegata TaxID=151549 RepID=A0A4C1WF49_EUMVA|nr:hypothetical protein EVAR_39633_1 [Eumeta japonica]